MTLSLRLAALLAVTNLTGCGTSVTSTRTQDTSLSDSADATAAAYSESTEDSLDQTVFKNDAKTGERVVTLYFGGGVQRNCAKWTVTVKGQATPVQDSALDVGAQGLLKANSEGGLGGIFKTEG